MYPTHILPLKVALLTSSTVCYGGVLIHEVPGSILGLQTKYYNLGCSQFSSVIQTNCGVTDHGRSTSFLVSRAQPPFSRYLTLHKLRTWEWMVRWPKSKFSALLQKGRDHSEGTGK